MLEMEQFKQDLAAVRASIEELGQALDIERLKEQLIEYQEDMASNGFWDDMEHAQKINQKAHGVEARLQHYKSLNSRADDIEAMMELAEEADDESMAQEIAAEFASIKAELEQLRLTTLLRDEYDSNDCILALHAGAGGTEAQDWTQMLYRMYTRFAERMGFAVRELDLLDGDEAGIKSVTFEVKGEYAYGFLKSERGVHRLVRISPFDANARRHTSFASLDVAPIIEDNGAMEIRTEDLRIDTYRASGKGGQHVNRTDSAVRITHLPTGLVVTSQDQRSQIQNREKAMQVLRTRLYDLERQKKQDEYSSARKSQVGTGDRSERIRTYNFPQGRVTDHRIGLTLYKIDDIMNGDLEEIIDALKLAEHTALLAEEED